MITQYWSWNHFTTNKLIDRTRNFKSNASRFKQKKYERNAPQARCFMKQNAPQARFIKQMRRRSEFLTQS